MQVEHYRNDSDVVVKLENGEVWIEMDENENGWAKTSDALLDRPSSSYGTRERTLMRITPAGRKQLEDWENS